MRCVRASCVGVILSVCVSAWSFALGVSGGSGINTGGNASGGSGKKTDKLEKTTFAIALTIDSTGYRRLEAIPKPDLANKRKSMMKFYQEALAEWQKEYLELKKRNPNVSANEAPARPAVPQLIIVKDGIFGQTQALEDLKELEKQYAEALKEQPDDRGGALGMPEPVKPEDLPKGNLAENPGFEELHQKTNFASGWLQDQWGQKGAQYYIRSDKGNPHTGDLSIVVRAAAEGSKPGVHRTLTMDLPAATYEVRFWACCEVGGKAVVGADLAGAVVGPSSVGEDWTQIRQRITFQQLQKKAVFKLWTETPRVKVYFDDVEIVAVPCAPEKKWR